MLASETNKHYKVGFVAGTFDLFHIGHLNLIRRAKERCDFLYAGVLEDACGYNKSKWPIIPQNERLAIVGAIREVDEAVLLTLPRAPKLKIWEDYHYDAFFSGDDYVNNPYWIEEERQLNEWGADLVYFSYTKERSSTKVQEAILPPVAEATRARRVSDPALGGQGFRFLFPFDQVAHGERVVIYGAGDVGQDYARQIEALGFCNIVAFADRRHAELEEYCGFPVWAPEFLVKRQDEYGRVVVATTIYYDDILLFLRSLHLPQEKIV